MIIKFFMRTILLYFLINLKTFLKLSSQSTHVRLGNEVASSVNDFASELAIFILQYSVAFIPLDVQGITGKSFKTEIYRLFQSNTTFFNYLNKKTHFSIYFMTVNKYTYTHLYSIVLSLSFLTHKKTRICPLILDWFHCVSLQTFR